MSALPAPAQRWLTILVPVLALGISAFVLVPRQARLRATEAKIDRTRSEIRRYITQLESIRHLPPDPMIASMPFTKEEQTTFLRGLTTLCSQTGNHITSVQSLAAPQLSAADDAKAKKKPEVTDLPADVTAIKSTIVFEGNFRSLIGFMGGLDHTRRLISLTDCRVEGNDRKYPLLSTTVSLTRYVDSGPVQAPPAPGPQSAENPSAHAPG